MVCFYEMMGSGSVLKLALLLTVMGNCAKALSTPVDIDNLESLGNNTLFEKWRPRYHFAAPAGWMNVRLYMLLISYDTFREWWLVLLTKFDLVCLGPMWCYV